MKALLAIAAMAVIALVDLRLLLRERARREMAVYGVFFALVTALMLALALGADIPSPIRAVWRFYSDVLRLGFAKY